MLKRVMFVLDAGTFANEEIAARIRGVSNYLKECGYESDLLDVSDDFFTGTDPETKSTSLIATDTEEIAKILRDKNFFVVGILHEQNPNEKFAGLKYVFSEIEEVDADSFLKVYQRYAKEPWTVIRTDRLIIRETTLDDVDIFYKIYSDPEITRFMEGLFENPEDEKRYQKDYIEKVYALMGFGLWTVVRADDGEVVGRAGYSVRNGFEDIELGFLIGKAYQGQGYAYEACSAILDYGRDVLLFDKVQTLVKKENTVSGNLCKKLGFTEVDEVNVEENIYGNEYKEESKVTFSSSKYGSYLRFIKYL